MEHSIAIYFLLFLIYSAIGWSMEVTLQIIQKHKLADRGFLIGPYCPIYGCGAILITIGLTRLSAYPIAVFAVGILICGVLEYVTSYLMEKIFKARWWDYSDNKFNINGRICLETIIPFGILGLVIIYVTNPFLIKGLTNAGEGNINVIAIVLAVLFFIDNIISFKVISNVKATAKLLNEERPKDNTDEISKAVREFLRNKSFLNRRLVDAFPNLTAKIKETREQIKKKTAEVREGINNKASEVREELNNKAEEAKKEFNETAEKLRKGVKDGIAQTSDTVKSGLEKARNITKKSQNKKKDDE